MNEEPTQAEREALIEKIKQNRSKYLVMNQVPDLTKQRFIELANTENDGNYGFTLKYLMDIHDGICQSNHEEILFALQDLNARLSKLEADIEEMKNKKPVKAVKMTLAGKPLGGE